MHLAVTSYTKLPELADTGRHLNLAWTLDERETLSADLGAVLAEELAAELSEGMPYVHDYPVKDPYAEAALGPALAEFFSRPGWPASVTCGAGVGPLLQGLASLAGHRGTVYVASAVYPDFPVWAGRAGARCVGGGSRTGAGDGNPDGAAGPDADTDAHLRAVAALAPSVVLLERPAFTASCFSSLDALRRLCDGANGAVVLVDESNANYCPPEFSAVHLVEDVPNLLVVRGLSKAYGLGGLRLGYCVASPPLAGAVRHAVPPLQLSSLSVRLGRRVLGLGDIAGPLRERITAHKKRSRTLLQAAGFPSAQPAEGPLPYVLIPHEPERAFEELRALGIQGKLHPVWQDAPEPRRVCRVSVPLRGSRLAELERRTAARP